MRVLLPAAAILSAIAVVPGTASAILCSGVLGACHVGLVLGACDVGTDVGVHCHATDPVVGASCFVDGDILPATVRCGAIGHECDFVTIAVPQCSPLP